MAFEPDLGKKEILYIDDWKFEKNYFTDFGDGFSKLYDSILLNESGSRAASLGLSRFEINRDLWVEANEFSRVKNETHMNLLSNMNLDASEYELRPISLFEYWRLINDRIGDDLGFNRQKKWTHCNEYLGVGPIICGYNKRTMNSDFRMSGNFMDFRHSSQLVRLVLARKIKPVS